MYVQDLVRPQAVRAIGFETSSHLDLGCSSEGARGGEDCAMSALKKHQEVDLARRRFR